MGEILIKGQIIVKSHGDKKADAVRGDVGNLGFNWGKYEDLFDTDLIINHNFNPIPPPVSIEEML